MLVVDLELLDLSIKLLNELPKLGLGQGIRANGAIVGGGL